MNNFMLYELMARSPGWTDWMEPRGKQRKRKPKEVADRRAKTKEKKRIKKQKRR
jgi:hypothetical protein